MKFDDFKIGHKSFYKKKDTMVDNDMFRELSGDDNPIHFDEKVARRCGFKGRISNGFVTESRIAAAIVKTFGSDGTVVLALKKETKFRKPVYMDDEIIATVEVVGRQEATRILKIKAECFNQHGEQVVDTTIYIKIIEKM